MTHYFDSTPLPQGLPVQGLDSRIVWLHEHRYARNGKDRVSLATSFYFTRQFAVTASNGYECKLERIYIFWLGVHHNQEDTFNGVGVTLREAYENAWRNYRTEMRRRHEEERRINHLEMWREQAWLY